MSNQLTRFEVSNFKKFDRLVVENIGQVNLITGDNNVGKTSLLEVLLLEPNMKQILSSLDFIFHKRKIRINNNTIKFAIGKEIENKANNLIGLSQNDINKNIDILQTLSNNQSNGFFIKNIIGDIMNNKDSDLQKFANEVNLFKYNGINSLSKNWLIFYRNNASFNFLENKINKTYDVNFIVDVTSSYYFDFLDAFDYFPFIRIEDFYANDIIPFFDEITKSSKEKKLFVNTLNKFFATDVIEDVLPKTILGNNILCIATQKKSDFHPITYYGDGFVRTVRIVLEILMNRGKRLMIDEIETGLHFSRQKEVWKTVMTVAYENDVQLFCTTHSQDCIKAFVEAAEEMSEMKDKIRLIELEEFTKDNKLQHTATTYEFDALKYKLEVGTNVRGGDVWQ